MALINDLADILEGRVGLSTVGGEEPWSIFLDLMPDRPVEAVCIYPKQDPVRDGVREAAGVQIRVRGTWAKEVFDTLEAILDRIALQPVPGWLAWSDSNMGSEGEGNQRQVTASAEVTFYRLCDEVDILRHKQAATALSYTHELVETLADVPALVVSESADRELYRGAMVHRETVQVYLKGGSISPSDRLLVKTSLGDVDVNGVITRGSGCARNALHLSGQRRRVV